MSDLFKQHQSETKIHEQLHQTSTTIINPRDYCYLCHTPPLIPPQHFNSFWNWYVSYSAKSYSSKTIEYFDQIVKGILEKPLQIDLKAVTSFIFSIVYTQVPGDLKLLQTSIIHTLKTQVSIRKNFIQPPPVTISAATSSLASLTPTQPINNKTTSTTPTMSITDQQLKELLKKVTDGFKETAQSLKVENHIFPIEHFYGKATEDPMEWLASFNRAATANNWTNNRRLQIAPGYLKGVAAQWFDDATINYWNNNTYPLASFEPLFIKRFTTLENKSKWHYELHNLQQEKNERVDEYSVRFKRLVAKVDPTNVFPDEYKI